VVSQSKLPLHLSQVVALEHVSQFLVQFLHLLPSWKIALAPGAGARHLQARGDADKSHFKSPAHASQEAPSVHDKQLGRHGVQILLVVSDK